jgi:hypothetical protein
VSTVQELARGNLTVHYVNGSVTSRSEKYVRIGDTLDMNAEHSQRANMCAIMRHCS